MSSIGSYLNLVVSKEVSFDLMVIFGRSFNNRWAISFLVEVLLGREIVLCRTSPLSHHRPGVVFVFQLFNPVLIRSILVSKLN